MLRARHARRRLERRRRRPLARALLRRRQRRGGLEGQPLHGRNLRRQARAEVHRQRTRAGRARRRSDEAVHATRACVDRQPRWWPLLGDAGRRGANAGRERAAAQATVQAPRFEVDPFWPKPLPNGWVLGMTIGVGVDSQDHVWIVHRADTRVGRSKPPPTRSRRPRRAAARRRRCSSSIRPAISSATGAGRAKATNGRCRITASSSTTRTTSGSAATTPRTRTS